VRLKIHGGTASGDDAPLCNTCRYATLVRGARLRDEIIECGVLSYGRNRITFPVRMCTDYVHHQHPSIREMEDIAWVLRTDSAKRVVGFVQGRASRRGEGDE
jgi:hypothetical protein